MIKISCSGEHLGINCSTLQGCFKGNNGIFNKDCSSLLIDRANPRMLELLEERRHHQQTELRLRGLAELPWDV